VTPALSLDALRISAFVASDPIPVAGISVISIGWDNQVRVTGMTSESVANILGWIVGAAVLTMAVMYGPLGQFGKPPRPAAVEQPAPAAPAPRGPVIREVPN